MQPLLVYYLPYDYISQIKVAIEQHKMNEAEGLALIELLEKTKSFEELSELICNYCETRTKNPILSVFFAPSSVLQNHLIKWKDQLTQIKKDYFDAKCQLEQLTSTEETEDYLDLFKQLLSSDKVLLYSLVIPVSKTILKHGIEFSQLLTFLATIEQIKSPASTRAGDYSHQKPIDKTHKKFMTILMHITNIYNEADPLYREANQLLQNATSLYHGSQITLEIPKDTTIQNDTKQENGCIIS